MTTRFLQLWLLLSLLVSNGAYAYCGSIPTPPRLLEQAQLDTNQTVLVETQLQTYLVSVEAYRNCIDEQISQLGAEDAPLEYFDSAEFQAEFEIYTGLSDQAESKMQLAIDRYNFLLVNATSAPE